MKSTTKKLTPKQAARRQAIQQHVLSHLVEHGLEGLSMRNIAQETGVSTNTLYGIYGSKESLILYSVSDVFSFLAEQEVTQEAGIERFLSRLLSIADAYKTFPDLTKAVAMLLFQGTPNPAIDEVLLTRAIDARATSLREMIDKKQLNKDFDIDFHARTLVSLLWGTTLFWVRGQITIDQLGPELVKTAMHQILPGTTGDTQKRVQEIIEEYSR